MTYNIGEGNINYKKIVVFDMSIKLLTVCLENSTQHIKTVISSYEKYIC